MYAQKDVRKIRFVGALAFGFGFVMLILTAVATLFVLFSRPNINYVQAAAAFALLLLTSSTLLSCGTHLATLRLMSADDVQHMRLNWTALFLVMIVSGIAGVWLVPSATDAALAVIIALLAVRPAVIRLSA